jgi:hypothetical protein
LKIDADQDIIIGQTTDSSNLRGSRFDFFGFFKNTLKKYLANPIIVIEMKWGGVLDGY